MEKKQTVFGWMRRSRAGRIICAFTALNLLAEVVSPTVAMALTSGPAAPEFSSFEPVATTDMVNDFSGDFTYNIPVLNVPGPDGPGYSMSLSYHSGASSEEEASWVGYGWTLNPGAINRSKRGYPDEFNSVPVTQYNKMRPNWTQSAKFDFNLEPNSNDQKKGDGKGKDTDKSTKKMTTKFKIKALSPPADGDGGSDFPVSVSLSHTIRYNNHSGFSIANGASVSEAGGMGSLSMNRSGNSNTLGFSVNPLAIMTAIVKKHAKNTANEKLKRFDKGLKKIKNFSYKMRQINSKFNLPTGYSLHSYNTPALAYSVAKNSAASWNFSASIQINPNIPVGFQVGLAGNMNLQASEGERTNDAFGYMYSASSNTNNAENQVFDFQVENESTFDKHDVNLGIPFNNADVFSATGNDVVGGFRFHHDAIGSYYPNLSESETKIRQLSIELGIGATFQLGIDIGVGKQKTKVGGKWPKSTNYSGQEFSTALPAFRFNNDMGGELNYNDNYDDLRYATINSDKSLNLGALGLSVNSTKKQNSSWVSYSMNGGLIDGITVTGKDGNVCSYAQPVYTRNEAQLTVGLDANQDGAYLVTNPVYVTDPMKNNTVTGSKTAQQYAAAYLLTSNTTANYVDVDNNGPSVNDFGGWTKFGYRQVWGGANPWYRFRSPYSGLTYNAGRMLNTTDQMGSMSCGEKEIYYLKCIETKSHIAFFVTNKTTVANFTSNFPIGDYGFLYNGGLPITTVTASIEGSGTSRNDGLDAAAIDGAGKDPAAENLAAKGTHELEKLERVVLFAKSDLTRPLSTTFFEYDYSVCQGIPNTLATPASPSKERGKLTLKRVWSESNGVNRSVISPYQFHYEYFNQYPAQITSKYPWAAAYNLMPSNDANQNPFYHSEQLDAWGNYQENGDKRFENMQPWLSQKTMSANTTFDPAAWQLKRIQLPSGGEIHVNYEQKDYCFVQDKLPMAMVSLLPDNVENGYASDESVYCINLADVDVQSGSVSSYSTTLHKYFVEGKNKLYFKMLYNYSGDATPKLNAKSRQYEYVTGYTVVNEVSTSGSKIFLHLGDKRNKLATPLNTVIGDKKDKTLPRYVCYQELMTNGYQNLGLNARAYKDENFVGQAYSANPDLKKVVRDKVLENTVDMFLDWVGGLVKNVPKKEACKELNFDLSYFKLPVFNAKRGGGIRVKRLVTYDPGISGETGDATVFGSEYIYENENGSSSGVATNEPASIREENALVVYHERKKQKFINKITNGRDTKQFEACLGESVMPGAEVGHSRIVIKNIREAVSTGGYAINKYHTAKDFPFEVDYSDISKKNDTYKKFNLNVPLGIFNMSTNRAWVTQGYIFKLNDMHGKIASKTTYPGFYDPASFSNPPNTSTPYSHSNPFRPIGETYFADPSATKKATEPGFSNKTVYNYSSPGQKIASLVYDKPSGKITKAMLSPGTEEDFTIFTSAVAEKTNDFSIEVDLNLSFPPPVLTVGFGASFSLTDNLFCQHVTSKVVSSKSYLLSTMTINDGITQTTENLAFDRYTGDPVLTRTFDGYMAPTEKIYTQTGGAAKQNGYLYSLNIPAAWMYTDLRAKSQNTANINQLSMMAGNVVTYSTNTLYDLLLAPAATATAWSPSTDPLQQVINATATTYANNWFNAGMSGDYSALTNTAVLAAANRFYYPERSYSYRDEVVDANATNGRIYKAGMTATPFAFFDWNSPNSNSSKWYSDSRVTRYAPYGYPIEEEDVLLVKSAARFGYDNTLPVLVAKNAAFGEARFLDFEYGYGNNNSVTTAAAHTGRASYDLSSNQNYAFVSAYPITAQILQKGLAVKLWLKSSQSNNINSNVYNLKNPNPLLKLVVLNQMYDFKRVAQTGDWTLYSAEIKNFNGLSAGSYNLQLSYNYLQNEQVLVDDFRVQPLEASMNCSVYYADNKLAAQFDDQHFGVLYEYNNKGQLVRKSIETERGRKTLQEQQYNTPTLAR